MTFWFPRVPAIHTGTSARLTGGMLPPLPDDFATKSREFAALFPGDLGNVGRDLLRLGGVLAGLVAGRLRAGARHEHRRHPALPRPADQDRVHHALRAHGADLVEVRARNALGARGLERVAAPAVLAEERLALVELLAPLLVRQRSRGPF